MQTFQFLCMSLIPTKSEAVPFARNTKIFRFEGIFECSSVSAIFLHSCLMTGCSLKLLTLQPALESARPLARVDCRTLPTMDSVLGGPGWGPGICIPNRFQIMMMLPVSGHTWKSSSETLGKQSFLTTLKFPRS